MTRMTRATTKGQPSAPAALGEPRATMEMTMAIRARRALAAAGHARVHTLLRTSLLRTSAHIMATTLLTSALGYVYWIVAARTNAPHEVGLASALISAMSLAATLANLGLGSWLIQVLPGRAAGPAWSRAVNAALVAGGGASLLAGAVMAVALPRLSPQFALGARGGIGWLILALGVAVTTLATVLDQVFVAERAAGNMLARNALFAALKIPLLVAPVALLGLGAGGILFSWVAASAATVAVSLALLLPRLGCGYRIARNDRTDFIGARGLLAELRGMRTLSLGHHLINLGGLAPMYVIPLLVTARVSATASAYYYTTWMLGSVFFMISSAVSSALFAEGTHAVGALHGTARASARMIALLLAPTMLVFLLGGRVIMGVFGASYASHGVALLDILAIAAVPDAITNVFTSVLRVRGRLRDAARLNLGMAALAIALAWLLLPAMGVAGAGLAWLLGQTAGCGMVLAELGKGGWRAARWLPRLAARITALRRRAAATWSAGCGVPSCLGAALGAALRAAVAPRARAVAILRAARLSLGHEARPRGSESGQAPHPMRSHYHQRSASSSYHQPVPPEPVGS